VSFEALERAIALNGVQVDMNRKAFLWGRRAAADLAAVERVAAPAQVIALPRTGSLDEIVERRSRYLIGYQGRRYARRYRRLVERVRKAEAALDSTRLAEAVARGYFRLLAYKDEYEVARLYADPAFQAQLDAAFEGDYRLTFHLAPPLRARRDPATGEPRKRAYGPGTLTLFRILARLRFLRGTPLDLFGRTAERRMEQQLIRDYEGDIARMLSGLDRTTHETAIALAGLPEQIRGFGHVKMRSIEAAAARRSALWEAWKTEPLPEVKAA
jgi:indolepyruvate ferredoxin oxidoreductase